MWRRVIILILFQFPYFGDLQSCSSGCDVYGNYCYIVSSNDVSNSDAKSYCSSAGGQLPFFGSSSDLADYNSYKTSKLGGASTWLGYWNYNPHSPSSPGNWVDSTGITAPFTSWNSGEPNDSGGSEPCVQTVDGNSWNDISCSNTYKIICMCKCPPIAAIQYGSINYPSVPSVNSITSFSCNSGYSLSGLSSIKCIPSGGGIAWSGSPPTCIRNQCPASFFNLATGTPVSGPYYSLTSYDFNCGPGYISNTSSSSHPFTCGASGTWTTAFVPCSKIRCPNIFTTTTGTPPVQPYEQGSTYTYTCVVNFKDDKQNSTLPQYSCSYSGLTGVWTPATFNPCSSKVECLPSFWDSTSATGSPPSEYPLGHFYGGLPYTFTCLPNYLDVTQNSATPTYTCMGTSAIGSWAPGTFVPCTNTCPAIPAIANGTVVNGTSSNTLARPTAGTIATFICAVGYYVNGSNTTNCLSDGTWSNPFPECLRKQCPRWFTTGTGNPDPPPYYSGSSYNFTCATNYVTSSGLTTFSTYNCILMSGAWAQSSFVPCTATCPKIWNITYGNVTGGDDPGVIVGRVMAGGVANFSCNTGYDLLGQQNLTCLSTGNWSDAAPVCQNNCSMTLWSSWSSCSASCGDGVNTRTREVIVQATYQGVCWNKVDRKPCDAGSCWEVLLSTVLMTFSCAFLLGMIAFTFILNLVWRIRHLERLIHACEEVTLFIAHIFILFLRGVTFNPLLCKITATVIQYCMVSCFTFFALEGIQMYSYVTSVLGRGNFMPPYLNLLIGFGVPFAITVPTAAIHHGVYPSYFTCWLNWGNLVSMTSTVPIILGTWIAVILVESAGMGLYDSIVNRSKVKFVAGKFSQKGLILVAPSCLAHWFVGMYATYYQKVAIYFAVTITFVTLGVLIFIHHGLCHRLIAVWAIKFWFRIRRKKGPLPDWATEETEETPVFSAWKNWFYLKKKPKPPAPKPVVTKPKNPPPKPIPFVRQPLGPEVWLTHEELFSEALILPVQHHPLPRAQPTQYRFGFMRY